VSSEALVASNHLASRITHYSSLITHHLLTILELCAVVFRTGDHEIPAAASFLFLVLEQIPAPSR